MKSRGLARPLAITEILFDPQDAGLLSSYRWRLNDYGYVVCRVQANAQRRELKLSRLLLDAPLGLLVDHINGNKLDNRRENLRLVNTAENAQNRPVLNSNNSSGYRGVHWRKREQKWQVRVGGKSLGYFSDPRKGASVACDYRKATMPAYVCRCDLHLSVQEGQ